MYGSQLGKLTFRSWEWHWSLLELVNALSEIALTAGNFASYRK